MIIWHREITEKMVHVYGNVILAIVTPVFIKIIILTILKNVDSDICYVVLVKVDIVVQCVQTTRRTLS